MAAKKKAKKKACKKGQVRSRTTGRCRKPKTASKKAMKKKTTKAKRGGKKPTSKSDCTAVGGRWVTFKKPKKTSVCFVQDVATPATKKKRAAALKKARRARR